VEQKYLRGLFSGGTLCDEAVLIWTRRGFTIWSNRPRSPKNRLEKLHQSRAHCALDLGEEEFTLGRPHPMIDHDLRLRRLLSEAQDPTVAVLQLDVVLGYGAHPDPAGEIGPAIAEAKRIAKVRGDELIVVASITGTDADPQNRSQQRSILEEHGTLVFESNALASVFTAQLVDPEA
jgi:FdrA protein